MAVSETPLVWQFYREVPNAVDIGATFNYFDESGQSLFLKNGIATNLVEPEKGHWEQTTPGATEQITSDPYSKIRFDHVVNGTIHGLAIEGSDVIFLRYAYTRDVSSLLDDWSWVSQIDNSIEEFSATVKNIGPLIYHDDMTLFQPGSRIQTGIKVGDSDIYPMGIAWIDETDLDDSYEHITLSARNTIGRYLRDQTFDDQINWSGQSSKVASDILDYAGIENYEVQANTTNITFEFSPSDTLLDGIQELISFHTYDDRKWRIVELKNGKILIGYESWINNQLPNGYYTFHEGDDVFKRKTNKASDSSYTSLRVTGKDANNEDLTPVTVPINNFPYWRLGAHKTKHVTAPDGLTQSELQSWANTQAKIYQYIGIGEDFVSPFRPHLLVGDIAEESSEGKGISLGIITEVTQSFSTKGGYITEFSVDSGGVSFEDGTYLTYTRAADAYGFNRRQRVIDLVRLVSGK